MTETEPAEIALRLHHIEAIKQLKYTYLRSLDLNMWDDLAECLAEDVVCWYDSGRYQHEGRAAVLDFLRSTSLAKPHTSSLHLASHPVISIESDDRAVATWALNDTVVDHQKKSILRGAAYYRDEYVMTIGGWRIASTGYDRLWELRDPLSSPPADSYAGDIGPQPRSTIDRSDGKDLLDE